MNGLSRIVLLSLLALCLAGAGPRTATMDEAASYPEGPLYWGGGLLVAEMGADRVSRYDGAGKRVFFQQIGCGPTAVAPYGDGLVVLCHLSARLVFVTPEGRQISHLDRTGAGLRLRNPNDVSADDRGGVYFSDPGRFSKDIPAEGALFYLDKDGVLSRISTGLWYPNGVFFDRHERALYVSEHLAGRVWRYPVGARGALGHPRLVVDVKPYLTPGGYREAGPDGLEIGPDRRLMVAIYGEGKLLSVALPPARASVRQIPVPIRFVTNIAFGPGDQAVVVGPIINDTPPFPGVVMGLPRR